MHSLPAVLQLVTETDLIVRQYDRSAITATAELLVQ